MIRESFLIKTLPMIEAVGARNTEGSYLGSKFRCFIIIFFHLLSFTWKLIKI
ncbi:MAG: hypothetical protein ACFFC1_17405 [Promethearchaeota archaeon]